MKEELASQQSWDAFYFILFFIFFTKKNPSAAAGSPARQGLSKPQSGYQMSCLSSRVRVKKRSRVAASNLQQGGLQLNYNLPGYLQQSMSTRQKWKPHRCGCEKPPPPALIRGTKPDLCSESAQALARHKPRTFAWQNCIWL